MQCANRPQARWCRLRRASAALLICSAILYAAPAARAASAALWIADTNNDRVDEYLPKQIKHSNSPTPITIPTEFGPTGVCFDKSNSLWVTEGEILGFTAAELKKLPTAPTPAVTITSSSFVNIAGCTFDKQGDLWVADQNNASLDQISAAQLKAGSATLTPATIITSSGPPLIGAAFVAFDASGNLWTAGGTLSELFEFSASQLGSGGAKAPAVILEGGGDLADPSQLEFDSHGNLWVASFDDGTVVMFSKSQLGASNDDPPAVTISSSAIVSPIGLAFHSNNLWILNHYDGDAEEFDSKQLKSSGTSTAKVVLTGVTSDFNWQMTFGPSYGK